MFSSFQIRFCPFLALFHLTSVSLGFLSEKLDNLRGLDITRTQSMAPNRHSTSHYDHWSLLGGREKTGHTPRFWACCKAQMWFSQGLESWGRPAVEGARQFTSSSAKIKLPGGLLAGGICTSAGDPK